MAELVQEGKLAIRPLESMQLTVRELDALGRATEYGVPIPTTGDFAQWSVVQQIAMLKSSTWNRVPVSQIIFGIAYANKLGLDIMQGDVYTTGDGRIAMSNKAKIKLALRSGNITGIETQIKDLGVAINLPGCTQKTDLECVVTIGVKGWPQPIRRSQRLSEWFMPANPNWKGRPAHMLELSTISHACELVNPTETGDDEAPPKEITAAAPVAVVALEPLEV